VVGLQRMRAGVQLLLLPAEHRTMLRLAAVSNRQHVGRWRGHRVALPWLCTPFELTCF
jgi:hypothetical protein